MATLSMAPSLTVGLGHEVARSAAPAIRPPARRAVLVGTTDPQVSSLLTDVLRDIQLDVEIFGESAALPDVVLAMVDSADGVRAIVDARARFPRVPVVAILTLGTHRLGTRAVAAGAQACFMLDMPIDRLRALITALLHAPQPEPMLRRIRR